MTKAIVVAIFTSLIASVIFWFVFDFIPTKRATRKLKPLIDFDLYQIYTTLFFFIETPFRAAPFKTSYIQRKLINAQITREDFERFLSTKCLSKYYQRIDEFAKNLQPIGEKMESQAKEIINQIQKIYLFNHYLTPYEILLCRRIADIISMYSFQDLAYSKVGTLTFYPADPSMRHFVHMMFPLYNLFLQLQYHLINKNGKNDEFNGFYKDLFHRKISTLYGNGKYKKAIRLCRGKKDNALMPYLFLSMFALDKKIEALQYIKDFLSANNEKLIYLRSYFEPICNDPSVVRILILCRSKEEYDEMMSCINKESEQKEKYYHFAESMYKHYKEKN